MCGLFLIYFIYTSNVTEDLETNLLLSEDVCCIINTSQLSHSRLWLLIPDSLQDN